MPVREDGDGKHQHEDYSAAIIRTRLKDAIEGHQLNRANWGIHAESIAALLEGKTGAAETLFWRDLITGQLDADRMDYLLRDSLHTGARSGAFDLDRIVSTIVAIPRQDQDRPPRLGISEGGVHSAESLVLARYFMFTQVYFHKTRIAYDQHLQEALKAMLPGESFPLPIKRDGSVNEAGIEEYLSWDDWRVQSQLQEGNGGDHGRRLLNRDHYREAFHTVESPTDIDLEEYEEIKTQLGARVVHEAVAGKAWYKMENQDVPVFSEGHSDGAVRPLSHHSKLVGSLKPIAQRRLYVEKAVQEEAKAIRDGVLKKTRGENDQ